MRSRCSGFQEDPVVSHDRLRCVAGWVLVWSLALPLLAAPSAWGQSSDAPARNGVPGDSLASTTDARDAPPSATRRSTSPLLLQAAIGTHASLQMLNVLQYREAACPLLRDWSGDDDENFVLGVFGYGVCVVGTGAAAYGVTTLLTRESDPPYPAGLLALYGGGQGAGYGAQAATLIRGSDSGDDPHLALLVGGVTGLAAGTWIGYETRWSDAHANLVALNGVVGSTLGYAAGQAGPALGLEDDARWSAGLSMLGSLAGMYGGHRMGRTHRHTPSDGFLYGYTAVLATGTALGVARLAGADHEQGNAAAVGGGLAGLALGRLAVRNRHWSPATVRLPLAASGGLGLASLLVTGLAEGRGLGNEDVSARQLQVGAVGAAAGLAAGYAWAVSRNAFGTPPPDRDARWSLHVAPRLDTAPTPSGDVVRASARVWPQLTLRAAF